ncbi:MAG: SCP2 sterol-binding domain-containing protein [Thermoleophilaceae bacterium]|nr:SCP2 sterol-binding domain-containing protein [Thermoleophilaceae bacterium]
MKFARLVAEETVEAAVAAVQASKALGFDRVWLIEGGDSADPRLVAGAARVDGLKIVLQLDAREDTAVPPGLPIELAVAGEAGWTDSLGALLGDSPYDPDPDVWVVAGDVGTIAAAGRAGVGAAFHALDDPESAADWTAEYEGELSSESARAVAGSVNAQTAVFLESGEDADALVGLVERYREAGVDQVILSGACAGQADFMSRVVAEFDDDEVRSAAAEKAERLAPAIAAASGRATTQPAATEAAASETTPPRRKKKRNAKMARRVQAFQENSVRRMSDRQLELLVGNRVAIRGLFNAMAGMYQPSKAGDFEGPIEFTLETRHGPEVWTIDCSPAGATARRGATPDAKLHVEAKLADFLRVGVGEIAAPSAVLSGKLNVRGDFGLALKLGPMFGGPSAI